MRRTRTAISCPRSGGWCATGRRRRRSDGGITVRNDTGVSEGGEISLYYDPMIAKLVTHAPSRAAAIDAQARRARCLRDRRHPPQHSVPVGADAASALARGQALDRLHRRGVSRTAFTPQRAGGRDRARPGRGRGRDRSRAGRAQAADFRAARGARGDARAPCARCGSATSEIALDVARDGEAIAVRYRSAPRRAAGAC